MGNIQHGKYLIYGLEDPISKEIRYVGMSTSGLVRPKQHLMSSSFDNPNKKHYHVYCWIRKLKHENLEPNIVVLDSCEKEELYWLEQFYIKCFKLIGANLTNKVDGGPGMLGLKHSAETIERLRLASTGKKYSEETRKKLSQSHTGENHWNYGRKYSNEMREKLSEAHKNQISTPEQRAKISAALKGKKKKPLSTEHKFKQVEKAQERGKAIYCVELNKEFTSIRLAARELGISRDSIKNSLNTRKTNKYTGYTFKYVNKNEDNSCQTT